MLTKLSQTKKTCSPASVSPLSLGFNVGGVSSSPLEILHPWASSSLGDSPLQSSHLGSSSPGKQMTTKYQWALNTERAMFKFIIMKKELSNTPFWVFNLLLIDRNKQEVLFEDVHMSRPCLYTLVSPLPLTAGSMKQCRFKPLIGKRLWNIPQVIWTEVLTTG